MTQRRIERHFDCPCNERGERDHDAASRIAFGMNESIADVKALPVDFADRRRDLRLKLGPRTSANLAIRINRMSAGLVNDSQARALIRERHCILNEMLGIHIQNGSQLRAVASLAELCHTCNANFFIASRAGFK
jgi:hypothetical protein